MERIDSEGRTIVTYERKPDDPPTELQKENLRELLENPNRLIDLSDAREMSAEEWKGAIRFSDCRVRKEAISLRIDADVLAWLKKDGQGYQTRVNQMLRERMLEELKG